MLLSDFVYENICNYISKWCESILEDPRAALISIMDDYDDNDNDNENDANNNSDEYNKIGLGTVPAGKNAVNYVVYCASSNTITT